MISKRKQYLQIKNTKQKVFNNKDNVYNNLSSLSWLQQNIQKF